MAQSELSGVDVEGVVPCGDRVDASTGDECMQGGLGGTEGVGGDHGVLVVGVRGDGQLGTRGPGDRAAVLLPLVARSRRPRRAAP